MTGEDMLTFVPYNLHALERSENLLAWIRSWFGNESELLTPNDWFERGHDLEGGRYNKQGYWLHGIKEGKFIWAPPPAAADVCLEQLRIARIKRQSSTHLIVCPRLLTTEWRKQFQKAVDFYVEIPACCDYWPVCMCELLILGFCLPFCRSPPWQFRGTPKVLELVRKLRSVLQTDPMAVGNILQQFLLEAKRISSMPASLVWRMLYFTPRSEVSHSKVRGHERERKRSRKSSKD